MMGPEAMGVANANLHWSDDKVCRNFLCGTCPHTLFTNTVRFTLLHVHFPLGFLSFFHSGGVAILEARFQSFGVEN